MPADIHELLACEVPRRIHALMRRSIAAPAARRIVEKVAASIVP
jgi:hypothetical protein